MIDASCLRWAPPLAVVPPPDYHYLPRYLRTCYALWVLNLTHTPAFLAGHGYNVEQLSVFSSSVNGKLFYVHV